MKLHSDLQIGTATHTGKVRRSNEDDFLVLAPHSRSAVAARGRLLMVADGMGGVTGGAEASRAAVRAVARAFLDAQAPDDPEERMRVGFAQACRSVFELSHESPSLRGMGTTLTAINLVGSRAVLGHVGDSRCYRWRAGRLQQLTTDHALSGENRLTRCIGGGRGTEEVDVLGHDLQPGDRFLLVSDGLWETVPVAEIERVVAARDPQAAAEVLVRQAHAQGGPDNCTVVVVRVQRTHGDLGELEQVELWAEELALSPPLLRRATVLRRPRWPWVVLAVSALLAALALARAVFGVDLLGALLRGG